MATESNQIDLAEAQLLGFFHSHKGYGLTELITSMGLTSEEWEQLKTKFDLAYLSEDDKEQIERIVSEN